MTHAVYLVQIILSVLAVHISHSNAYYLDIWIEVINSKLIRMITCDKIEDFVALVTVVGAKCYANYDNRLDKQTLIPECNNLGKEEDTVVVSLFYDKYAYYSVFTMLWPDVELQNLPQ